MDGNRRDYTNASGYFCPTENAAVAWLDRPKTPARKTAPHKDHLSEADIKKLDAHHVMPRSGPTPAQAESRERLHKARQIQQLLSLLLSILGVELDVIRIKMPGGHYYRYDKADPRYSKSLEEEK